MATTPPWIAANVPAELIDTDLFKIIVRLPLPDNKVRIIDVSMLPGLEIDYDNLEIQMQEIPSQYAYWAALYSEARSVVAHAERTLRVRKARIYKEAYEATKDNAKSRIPVDSLKQIVEQDERVIQMDHRLQIANLQVGKLYHMVESIKIKGEMIRSLAGFKRQEQYQQSQ
jgi:hypothetical protein